MSPVSISRRELVVGAGAALGAVALPIGVIEAVAAQLPSTAKLEALPAVFDPAAFVEDLRAAGYNIQVARSASREDRGRASFMITAKPGRGFDKSYGEVMERWAERLDATPDHVEQVVAYGFGRLESGA